MLIIDIFGNFISANHPFLSVIRELDRSKDVRINLMGPVHSSLVHIQKRKYEQADIALGVGWPSEYAGMHEGDYRVKLGITSWETDKVPYGAYYGSKEILQKLDLLIVPSKWHKTLFEHVGVDMEVVPFPVANWIQPVDRNFSNKPFTFLCEGTLTLRANVGLTISAFLDLFQARDDVKLIMKTDSGTLGHFNFPYDNLEIIDQIYSPAQYRELLKKAHCFVYPSSGEYFPTSLSNAMASNIPAIVPNHSVFAGYGGLNLEIAEPTPATRYSKKLGEVGNVWKMDYTELKRVMAWAESHPAELQLLGQANGRIIRNSHNVNTVTGDIIKLIKDKADDN